MTANAPLTRPELASSARPSSRGLASDRARIEEEARRAAALQSDEDDIWNQPCTD